MKIGIYDLCTSCHRPHPHKGSIDKSIGVSKVATFHGWWIQNQWRHKFLLFLWRHRFCRNSTPTLKFVVVPLFLDNLVVERKKYTKTLQHNKNEFWKTWIDPSYLFIVFLSGKKSERPWRRCLTSRSWRGPRTGGLRRGCRPSKRRPSDTISNSNSEKVEKGLNLQPSHSLLL